MFTGIALQEEVGELEILFAGVGGRTVTIKHSVQDSDRPFFDLPPRKLRALVNIDLLNAL
jgi:hypothetical protein